MKRLFTLLVISSFFAITLQAQKVESTEFIQTLPAEEISAIVGGLLPIANDVDLYKVRYFTPDPEGNEHVASGLLAIPQDETIAFPMACLQHGTVAGRELVPSRLEGGYQLGVIFAGLGYVVVQPDYVGLGDSPGIHPYVHAETEASAGVDMLRATRELSADEDFVNFNLNGQIFISGYSQGGHAAMALHRELETNLFDEFTVTAAAHMSGPYSISEKMRDFTMGDAEYETVSYLASLTLGYQRAYPETLGGIPLEEVFKEQYLEDVRAFAAEEIDLWELNDIMAQKLLDDVGTVTPRDLLLPEFLDEVLNNPESPMAVALADNDTYDWAPKAPTNLYYCQGDEQVTYENAILASDVMKSNGSSTVNAIQRDNQFAPFSHTQCVSPASQAAILFFGIFQELSVSTQELEFDPNVQVYNSNNFLTVKIPSDKPGSVHQLNIFGQTGELLFSANVEKGISFHDISFLPAGLHIVTLNNENQLYKTEKITKF